jgi:hypothetical protein
MRNQSPALQKGEPMLRLLTPAALVVLLAALAATRSPSPPAHALVAFDCDAKIGVSSNPGQHPWLWPYVFEMELFFLAGQPDQPRDVSFAPSTNDVPAPVSGVLDPDGTFTGAGTTEYDGSNVPVSYQGMMTFYDQAKTVPKRLVGDYTLGPQGFPNNETISYRSDCFATPTEAVADPDADGKTAIIHGHLGFNSTATAQLSQATQALTYKDAQGNNQQITLADPGLMTFEDAKSGPFEAIFERIFLKIEGKFGGSFSQFVSDIDLNLPPELGGGQVFSQLSGSQWGSFSLDGAAEEVSRFRFDFSANGMPVLFNPNQGGVQPAGCPSCVSTGDWRLERDPDGEVTSEIDLVTGEATLTVPALLVAENLKAIYPDTPQNLPAGDGELPGEPLRFTETVLVTFPPFGAIAATLDNCPNTDNPDQADADGDGLGDACEGFLWADSTCNGFVGSSDALDTLLAGAGLPRIAEPGCFAYGDLAGGREFGDWDCDGVLSPADVIVVLRHRSDLEQLDLPGGCPEASSFISMVG